MLKGPLRPHGVRIPAVHWRFPGVIFCDPTREALDALWCTYRGLTLCSISRVRLRAHLGTALTRNLIMNQRRISSHCKDTCICAPWCTKHTRSHCGFRSVPGGKRGSTPRGAPHAEAVTVFLAPRKRGIYSRKFMRRLAHRCRKWLEILEGTLDRWIRSNETGFDSPGCTVMFPFFLWLAIHYRSVSHLVNLRSQSKFLCLARSEFDSRPTTKIQLG
ncbi:hypothetical protein C8R47DRAFT_721316 [Mycena vitilis]|nr:hypothetical protein C8R47DRAFT_721316 [Mycena vitilis]